MLPVFLYHTSPIPQICDIGHVLTLTYIGPVLTLTYIGTVLNFHIFIFKILLIIIMLSRVQ